MKKDNINSKTGTRIGVLPKKLLHIILLVFSGLGLGIYLLVSTHHDALMLSIERHYFAYLLKKRIICYCVAGIFVPFLATILITKLTCRKTGSKITGNRFQYGFYVWIFLLFSLFQLINPSVGLFFRFLFTVLMGGSCAYISYCLPVYRLTGRRAINLLFAAVGAYIVFFSVFSLQRHRLFMTHALDLGVFTQTLWGYSKGQNIINTVVFEPMYLLGDHWSPVAFLLVPLYWLWSDPRILLIIQSVFLGVGAIPLYLLTYRVSGSPGLGLGFSFAYLLFPGLHGINCSDFHYLSIVTPLFLLLFYLEKEEKRSGFYAVLLLLYLVREDISYHLFFFGIYLSVFLKKWRKGLLITCTSIAWFYLIMNVFLPSINPENPRFHMEIYSHLGQTVPEIILSALFHPMRFLAAFAEDGWKRLAYLFHLSIPVGFGFLASIQTLVLIMPSVIFNVMSNFRGQYTIKGQYNAPVIPFLFMSAIYGIVSIIGRLSKDNEDKKNRCMQGASIYLVVTGLVSAYYFSPTPLSRDGTFAEYQFTKHDRIAHRILKKIPAHAAVSAQSDLVPHLSHRQEIYVFPVHWRGADYVILDLYSTCFPVSDSDYRNQVRQLFRKSPMGILDYNDGVLLFKKDHNKEQNESVYRMFLPLLNHPRLPDGRVDIPKGNYIVPIFRTGTK